MSEIHQMRAALDEARWFTHASIGAAYVEFGNSLTEQSRILIITSTLNRSIWISTDGSTNNLLVNTNTTINMELSANKEGTGKFCFAVGTQFYVKQGPDGAPSSGDIAISVVYAN